MKRYAKGLSVVLIFSMLLGALLYHQLAVSYGNEGTNTIEVETYGDNTRGDPMFSGGLWAPGVQRSGIMRINNNYSQRIRVDNLAIKMDLERYDGSKVHPESKLYGDYAKSMKITITRGRFLVFNETLFEGSFYELLYVKDNPNYQGYQLPSSKQFNISRNDNADLKYTITMDGESSGNELQGLKAIVDFIVNLHENPTSSDPDSGGDNDDNDNDNELIEIEDEIIPLGDLHWAHDCVIKLMEEGIVRGYPDGSLRLDDPITRAETATIIAKALKLGKMDKLFSGYLDSLPDWARGYIIATTDAGIFEGYPVAIVGRVFKGQQFITREEMATVLMKAFKLKASQDMILSFTDAEDISDWALEYVKAGVENGIIVGYPDNTFKPQNNITRGEAFVMLCKLLGYHIEHQE